MRVVGADGCRGGWLVCTVDDAGVGWRVVASFAEVAEVAGEAALGVDMPVPPLPDDGRRRRADVAARAFLGPARSSIFWTPPRSALERWRRDPVHPVGIGVSIQTWNLLPKIAEVVEELQRSPRTVLEVHPECSFRAMAPGVMFASKKTGDGRAQRIAALQTWCELPAPGAVPAAVVEDALDATAVAWSVARWTRGEAVTLPADAEPGEPVIVV